MAVIRGKVVSAFTGVDYNAITLESGKSKTQYVIGKDIDVQQYNGKIVELSLTKNHGYVIKLPYVKPATDEE